MEHGESHEGESAQPESTRPSDACGPDCHETDCVDRVGCEYCDARPHRDTTSVHDSLAGDINLCAECSPHECDCECTYCEERFGVVVDNVEAA